MSRGLELVRRLAAVRERQARRDFADRVADLARAEAALSGLDKERERVRAELSGQARAGMGVDPMADAYRYLDVLARRVDDAASGCVRQRDALRKAEDTWVNARHNLQGMETVIARRLASARADRERRGQRTLDDLHALARRGYMEVE